MDHFLVVDSGDMGPAEFHPDEVIAPEVEIEQAMREQFEEGTGFGAGSSSTSPPDLSALNSKFQKQAHQWLLSRPLSYLTLWRIIMGPLDHLMQSQFKFSSMDWETCERASAALKGSQPLGSTPPDVVRDYRMVVAAEQRFEKVFMTELLSLFTSPMPWNYIEDHCLHISFRCLCFRVLSRAGCAVHQLLTHVHSGFPFKLFLVLKTPARAQEFMNIPNCLKDCWTLALAESFGDFNSAHFRQFLMLQGMIQQTDISNIESRHASIRRQLVSRSTQTTSLSASTLSAEWVFQNVRARMPRQKKQSRQVNTHTKPVVIQTPNPNVLQLVLKESSG